jgi:hypothetical protein
LGAFFPPFGSFKLSFLNIGQGLFLFKTLCSNTSTIISAQSAFFKSSDSSVLILLHNW